MPEFPDLAAANSYCERGDALLESGQPREALAEYRRALDIDPQLARAWYSAGYVLLERKEFVAAARSFRNGLNLVPDWPEALHNLGKALFELGHVNDACDCFRTAAAGPRSDLPAAMLATVLPGSPKATNQDILEVRRAFAGRLPGRTRKPLGARAADGRLRVGYVSSFFYRENWMKPVWALLNRHDRQEFEIHVFSDGTSSGVSSPPLQAQDHLHDTTGLTNELLAAHIENCGIDILVDLNGYSDIRRLPVLGMRPAPVIAGWFNLFATTGSTWCDYLIGDAVVIPVEEEAFYSEKILRVPGSYLTFEVSYPVPGVVNGPSATRGAATFGCLAPLYKITPDAIAAWSQILQRVPDSSLFLKNTAFVSETNRQYIHALFEQQGIPADRIRLEGPAPHYAFLAAYEQIDIALDTFPYSGGTTTTEAIWQGVPVVTFTGDRWVSRTSASILRAGGLEQFVARDVSSYIDAAVSLAADHSLLAELRSSLRTKLRNSAACDTKAFALNMERLYRAMAGLS